MEKLRDLILSLALNEKEKEIIGLEKKDENLIKLYGP